MKENIIKALNTSIALCFSQLWGKVDEQIFKKISHDIDVKVYKGVSFKLSGIICYPAKNIIVEVIDKIRHTEWI